MSALNLEERVAVFLEAQMEEINSQENRADNIPWWGRIRGQFKDDAAYDEAMRLGHEWRAAQEEIVYENNFAATNLGSQVTLVLDTDHLSILETDSIEAFNLNERLASLAPREVAVTIITYEEQMRGWLSYIAQPKLPMQQLEAYWTMKRFGEQFCQITVVDYEAAAVGRFEQLRQSRVCMETMDLKIAAICLANDATLLTRNLKHFSQVPDLKAEDWSV